MPQKCGWLASHTKIRLSVPDAQYRPDAIAGGLGNQLKMYIFSERNIMSMESNANQSGYLQSNSSTLPRRKKRWPLVVGGIILLLILLVLALPSLLCTGPGVAIMESQINGRIQGKIAINQLSLGWFSPVSVYGLSVRDSAGNIILSDVNLQTHLSLLHLATNWKNLGIIKLTIQNAKISRGANGFNIARAFAGRSTLTSTPITQTKPAAPVAAKTTAGGTQLPAIKLQFSATIAHLTFKSPTAPALQASNVSVHLKLNLQTANKPVILAFSSLVGVANQAPAKVAANATLAMFANRQMRPLSDISGQSNISISQLDLAAMQPVLDSLGLRIKPLGELNMNLAYASIASAKKVRGNISINHCVISGEAMKDDSAHLGQVRLPIFITWSNNAFKIQQLALTTELGSASITGGGGIAAIFPTTHIASTGGGTATLQIHASTPLAKMLSELRHTCKIPAGITLHGGNTTLAASMALGGLQPKKNTHGVASGKLPLAAGTLAFKLAPLTLITAGHARSHVLSANADIGFDTRGKPLAAEVNLSVTHGKGLPALLAITAKINALKNQEVLPVNSMTGTVELKAAQFAYFREILERLNAPLTIDGVLHGYILARITKPGQGTLHGNLVVNQMVLGGKLLHGDTPQLGQCVVGIDGGLSGGNITIRHFSVSTVPFTFSATGHTTLNAITAIRTGESDWGTTSLAAQMSISAPLIAANLAHTLKLKGKGLHLKTGSIALAANLTSRGQTSQLSADLAMTAMTGRIKEHHFTVSPVRLTAAAARAGTLWKPGELNISQQSASGVKIVNVSLQRTPGHKGSFTGNILMDIGALSHESSQITNMHGLTANGMLGIKCVVQHAFSKQIDCNSSVNLANFSVETGTDAKPIVEKSLKITFLGYANLPVAGLQSVRGHWMIATPEIKMTGDVLATKLKKAGWMVPTAKVAFDRGSIGGLARLLDPMVPALNQYRLAGEIAGSRIAASWAPGAITVSLCHLVVANVKISSTTPAIAANIFSEKKLSLDTAASITTGKSTDILIKHLVLLTADKVADVNIPKPLIVKRSATGTTTLECPNLHVTGDLAGLKPLLVAVGRLSANQTLTGQLALQGAVRTAGQKVTLNLQAKAMNYQLAITGNKRALPATTIAANIGGVADMTMDTFVATQNCIVSETAVSGTGSDSLEMAKGNVICWSDKQPENIHLVVNYDLARLNSLLTPFLPAGLKMSGTHSMTLAITGRLTNGNGLRKLRNLMVAPTALSFNSIAINGLTLGPGSVGFSENKGIIALAPRAIPANKGVLNLGGQVDLNKTVPQYIAANIQLANGIHLNSIMGGSMLKFLPIAWGGGTNGSGLMTISGQFNLRLKHADMPLEYSVLKKTGTFEGSINVIHLTSDSPLLGMIGNLAKPMGFLGNGSIKLSDSGIRTTNFNLKNGKVFYQHMKMVLTSFGLDFSGWVGLDNQVNQDVSITGAGMTVPVPLAITGTTYRPRLKLSGKPLKNIGKDVGNVLKKTGGNLLKNLFGH